MVERIKVRVLDYYNKPTYYPYMPQILFGILESAFLGDEEYIEVDRELFDRMINGYIAQYFSMN